MRKSFRSCLFVLFAILSSVALASVHEDHPYTFTISKHVYKYSEQYQIKSTQQDTYPGTVKKSAFRIRDNYDLSNKDGWQATGITRVLSPGILYHWAKDIDVYDTRGVKIGLISGKFATLEAAKFTIYEYDEEGNYKEIAAAYATSDFHRFAILETPDNPHPLAEINRNLGDKTWTVSVHYPEKLDDRLVRIFAGFIIDHEDKFLAQTDTETDVELD